MTVDDIVNVHPHLSSEARSQIFGIRLHLFPYFVRDETELMHMLSFVAPDLGPDLLQRFSAGNTSRQRVDAMSFS